MTQRILILSHDNKIGDAIVATGLFKPLRARWPDCEIGVLCGVSNAALYRHHPDVKWLHVSSSRNVFARMWASLKARWIGYDMVVHFGLDLANPSQQIVLNLVNAKQRYLFSKHPINPLPTDVVMDGPLASPHYSARHMRFLETLNAAPSVYQYDVRVGEDSAEQKTPSDRPLMVINSQSSTADRSLSLPWLLAFASTICERYAQVHMQLLSASPAHEADLARTFLSFGNRVSVTPYNPSVSSSLNVIRSADLVITPDTYAVHAASAWNIPVIALYLPNGPTAVWAPLSNNFVQIEASPGKTVSDIEMSEVMQAINDITDLCPLRL